MLLWSARKQTIDKQSQSYLSIGMHNRTSFVFGSLSSTHRRTP